MLLEEERIRKERYKHWGGGSLSKKMDGCELLAVVVILLLIRSSLDVLLLGQTLYAFGR